MFRTLILACALALSFVTLAQAQDNTTVRVEPGLTEPMSAADVVAGTQPAPAPPVAAEESAGSDFSGIGTLIKDTLVSALIALVTAAVGWLSAKLAQWTSGKIKLDDAMRDLHMEDYARRAVDKAFNYALKRAGVTWEDLAHVQIKNQVLQFAVNFLLSQYPEVVKWIDKDSNGIIDWIETLLPVISPAVGPLPAALMSKLDAPVPGVSERPRKTKAVKPAKAKKAQKDITIPAFSPLPKEQAPGTPA